MTPLLHATGVTHAFGANEVLGGVDFELAPGRLRVVLGPNGSGKTTLVRILSGVLQPRGGRVEIGGTAVAKLSRRQIAQRVAVVPQDTPVPFPYRVDEMVAMGRAPFLGPFGREGPDDRRRVEQALVALEVGALAAREYPTLSGGEKQRVLLARALAQGTPAMLLDEPTAHMDLGHRLQCFERLRAWIAESPEARGAAVISHDLMLAARYADDVTLLDAGRVVAEGAPAEVLTVEHIRAVYGVEARVETESSGRLTVTPLGTTRA